MKSKEEEISAVPNGAGDDHKKDDHVARQEISEQMDEESVDVVVQAIDELAVRSTEIETLKEELEQVTNQWKRQAAEFQNYRRRTEQEKEQMVSFGKGLVIQQILDVVDDFQRSLEATSPTEPGADSESKTAYESLKSGVDLVYQKLLDELKKLNVEPIEAVGQVFNEELHEAMMQQPASDGDPAGVVLSEIQRGWRMGDRVLRHSKVVVSS